MHVAKLSHNQSSRKPSLRVVSADRKARQVYRTVDEKPLTREEDELLTQLVNVIRENNCTVFVGAGANGDLLPSGARLTENWARRLGAYPFSSYELPRVAQFVAITYGRAQQKLAEEFSKELNHKNLNELVPRSPLGILPDCRSPFMSRLNSPLLPKP